MPATGQTKTVKHCTEQDFKLHASDFLNQNTEELAVGAALTATNPVRCGRKLLKCGEGIL